MQSTFSGKSQNTASIAIAHSNETGKGNSMPAVPVLQQKEMNEEEMLPSQTNAAEATKETERPAATPFVLQKKENKTGLPDNLKNGIESLSGFSMDDTKVHYNSSQPAQLNALAYAQGTDIHVAPGQEKHLAHEAWHVVQQKQGRVQATMQMKESATNDTYLQTKFNVPAAAVNTSAQPVQRVVENGLKLAEVKQWLEDDAGWDVKNSVEESLDDIINSYINHDNKYTLDDVYLALLKEEKNIVVKDNDMDDEDYNPRSEFSAKIPRSAHQTQTVGGKSIKLYNDKDGCLDDKNHGFDSTGLAFQVVDIQNSKLFKNKSLKASRYWHFKAANELAFNKNSGVSPAGLTWHHRKEIGSMQLVNRELHAAFMHRGGFAIWGS